MSQETGANGAARHETHTKPISSSREVPVIEAAVRNRTAKELRYTRPTARRGDTPKLAELHGGARAEVLAWGGGDLSDLEGSMTQNLAMTPATDLASCGARRLRTMSANDRATVPAVAQTASAERMRRHRQRRRDGLRVVSLQIREGEVAALVRRGLLAPEARNDPDAVVSALYVLLDRTLGVGP
jgi:hypothetical protein